MSASDSPSDAVAVVRECPPVALFAALEMSSGAASAAASAADAADDAAIVLGCAASSAALCPLRAVAHLRAAPTASRSPRRTCASSSARRRPPRPSCPRCAHLLSAPSSSSSSLLSSLLLLLLLLLQSFVFHRLALFPPWRVRRRCFCALSSIHAASQRSLQHMSLLSLSVLSFLQFGGAVVSSSCRCLAPLSAVFTVVFCCCRCFHCSAPLCAVFAVVFCCGCCFLADDPVACVIVCGAAS